MLKRIKASPPEIVFTVLMILALLGLSVFYRLPIILPSPQGFEFLGIHYLFPVSGIVVWAVCALLGQKARFPGILLICLPCYTLVLLVHFNIKLWAPHVNSASYDLLFWTIDQRLRPVVDGCFFIRKSLEIFFPYNSNFYVYAFISMFYISLTYHAICTPTIFRRLFLAVLFFQGLGALAYLPFPAVGPFIFEMGVSPVDNATQQSMLAVHEHLLAGGRPWMAANGSRVLMQGLGAMPSLHVGGSFLFLWFAARYGRILLPTYVPVFLFILVTSVASRWHYLADLPVGLALALASIGLASLLHRRELAKAADKAPAADLAPVATASPALARAAAFVPTATEKPARAA